MSIVAIVIALAAIGLILWLVNKYIPMQPPIGKILNLVVLVAVAFWLLKIFGIWDYLMQATI